MPPNRHSTNVRVEPDGLTYVLERTDVSATEIRAIWTFTPAAGSYFLVVHLGGLPSTGLLTSVRTTVQARRDYVQQIELDYSTPDTGSTSIATGAIPVYLDGQASIIVEARTSTGSCGWQGTAILIPAGQSADVTIRDRAVTS